MARRARKSRAGLARWKQLVGCLHDMNFAFNNIRIYPPAHKEVSTVIDRLHEGLTPILAEQDDVGFGFMDEMLYIEGAMSIEETANNKMLVDRFAKTRVKYLTMTKGVSKNDLLALFRVLNAEANKPSSVPPGELLAHEDVHTIHIVEAEVDETAHRSKKARRSTLFDWYQKTVDLLKPVLDQLRDGTKADLRPVYHVADDMMATIRTKGHEPFLLLPVLGRNLDPHTAHGVNVAILSCAMGEVCRLNSGQIQTLCVAALLHDLGRTIIPTDWTKNPSPLTLFERAVVHQHGSWGFLLLMRNLDVPPQIALLAAHHHGKPQTGPPTGEYGADIFHKIINMADSYDLASYSDRYYWKKHRPDRVLKRILRLRGKWYDHTIAKALAQVVGLHPVASLVRLDDGQRGVVVRNNPGNVARPRVFLFDAEPAPAAASASDPDAPPEEPMPVILDLMDLDDGGLAYRRSIEAVLGEGPDLDVQRILDARKEHLLSFGL